MQRRVTIHLDEDLYRSIDVRAGSTGVGRYIEELVERQLMHEAELEDQYREAAADEAAEREAQEWLSAPVDASPD